LGTLALGRRDGTTDGASVSSLEGRPMRSVFVNPERCIGCRQCEIACAVEHSASLDQSIAFREVPRPRKRVHVEAGPVPALLPQPLPPLRPGPGHHTDLDPLFERMIPTHKGTGR
jgi:ferredoxin